MSDRSNNVLSMGENWGDAREQRLGVIWFLGAGFAAILLALFLFNADRYLEKHDRRVPIGNLLETLRGAQTSIAQAPIDVRTGMLPPAAWYESASKASSHHNAAPAHEDEHHQEEHHAVAQEGSATGEGATSGETVEQQHAAH